MKERSYRETVSHTALKGILRLFMEPEGSSKYRQESTTGSHSEPHEQRLEHHLLFPYSPFLLLPVTYIWLVHIMALVSAANHQRQFPRPCQQRHILGISVCIDVYACALY
jgi:hypothetical protein